MKTFNSKCPHCSVELQIKNDLIGRDAACPACGSTFTVTKKSSSHGIVWFVILSAFLLAAVIDGTDADFISFIHDAKVHVMGYLAKEKNITEEKLQETEELNTEETHLTAGEFKTEETCPAKEYIIPPEEKHNDSAVTLTPDEIRLEKACRPHSPEFAPAVCDNAGSCKEQAAEQAKEQTKEQALYVTEQAKAAKRGIVNIKTPEKNEAANVSRVSGRRLKNNCAEKRPPRQNVRRSRLINTTRRFAGLEKSKKAEAENIAEMSRKRTQNVYNMKRPSKQNVRRSRLTIAKRKITNTANPVRRSAGKVSSTLRRRKKSMFPKKHRTTFTQKENSMEEK